MGTIHDLVGQQQQQSRPLRHEHSLSCNIPTAATCDSPVNSASKVDVPVIQLDGDEYRRSFPQRPVWNSSETNARPVEERKLLEARKEAFDEQVEALMARREVLVSRLVHNESYDQQVDMLT